MKVVELKPIPIRPDDFAQLEKRIKAAFRRRLYGPILDHLEIPKNVLKNAGKLKPAEVVAHAILDGKIQHVRGRIVGELDAELTKSLRDLGAGWDPGVKVFRITLRDLPMEVRAAISTSDARFQEKMAYVDRRIAEVVPAELAGSIRMSDIFDSSLWKLDREVGHSLKSIAVPPQLTPEQAKKIADEWTNNMELWIKDFAEKEIVELRKAVQASVFAGNRYESLVGSIQKSFGVTEKKAKFLARQETSLLMTKFKESRYTDSGVNEYRWHCVAGSGLHPVRPAHKKLDGSIQRWDSPPITTEPTEPVRRNNPGQDFNCRCMAIPIVKF